MRRIKWGKKREEYDMSGLETLLDKAYQPVKPRTAFVRKLQNQLVNSYHPIREEVRAGKQRTALLIGASLIGGVLTLLMGIRIVLTLIATITLLMQWRKHVQPEQVIVTRQAI